MNDETPATPTRTDFLLENHGSIFLLTPLNIDANEWIAANLPGDAQRFGWAVAIEPRYVADICIGIHDDGLVV